MGNSANNTSSDNNAKYLQIYLDEQIAKKRHNIGRSTNGKNYFNFLCCNTLEISFLQPV